MSERATEGSGEFVTIRDWLRHGVSRFNAAGLSFGHGTATAQDEAAYLILHTLHLPVDTLEPWLDARLTTAERARIDAIFERRISTRKPASYLTNEAWMQGVRFYVDERVIVPRSYIGELLSERLPALIDRPSDVGTVLDLCTGSGCLAILAAHAFPGAAIDAADMSADALAVAGRNVSDHGLNTRISLWRSDLFAALRGKRYDLILANPPYVRQAAIGAFPPEYRQEPVAAHDGGEDGLLVVRRVLAEAEAHLAPHGWLIVEVGTSRPLLERAYPSLPFLWLDTAESEGEVFAMPAAALGRADNPPAGKPAGLAARVRRMRSE